MSDETQAANPIDAAVTTPIDLGPMTSDPAASPESPRRHHKRRLTIISAVSALLVAGVGVGAYAGVRAWTGSGIDEPESAVPAATAAFVRLDLKPGYRDQVAFDGLAKKFPSAAKSTSDLVTDAERSMLKGSDLDFDTDVAPWFGQRAGVGAYAVDSSHVVALVALASTDDAKAKQVLSKEQARNGTKTFGYAVRDGYALLAIGSPATDLQAAAQRASSEAAKHALADDSAFRSTVSHLDGHNLLLGYGDLAKLGPMAQKLMGSAMALGGGFAPGGFATGAGLPGGALNPGALAGGMQTMLKSTGRFAIGASVVDNGVEIRMHSEGMPATLKHDVNALSALGVMPSSSMAGIALNGFDPNSETVKQMTASLSAIAGMSGGPSAIGSDMMTAVNGLVSGVLTAKLLTIDVGAVTAGKPNLVITADTGDASKATALAQSLGGLASNPAAVGSSGGIAVKQDGSVVKATVGQAPTGDALSGTPLFKTAMSGMGNSTVAAYIDVQKLIAAADPSGSHLTNLGAVKAIGLSATGSDTTSDELIRVVITK